jgi:hypothetical protein
MRKSYVTGCAAVLTLLVSSFAAAQTQSISGKVTASQIASTGSIGIWEKSTSIATVKQTAPAHSYAREGSTFW